MKKLWSRKWISSKQPRKQRKFRHRSPLHIRHKFMAAHLSPDLMERFGRRSLPVRKGDEVEIMVGTSKGLRGKIDRVDLKKERVYIEDVKVKKVDGSEVLRPIHPSDLRILTLNLDDKERQKVLDRAKPKEAKPKKKAAPKKRRKHLSLKKKNPGKRKTIAKKKRGK